MKTFKLFLLTISICFSFQLSAQQGINYKAIVKDGSGNVIANDLVVVQFTILQGVGETNVYQETFTPTTDANGLIILNIGEGTIVSGVFDDIDWGSDTHALKVEINTGGGLVDMGTSTFKTVPYALNAANAASKIDDLADGRSDLDGSSLFLGIDAGSNDDGSDNTNVGVGFNALFSNTEGFQNTATGHSSLYSNITGTTNTANGTSALFSNTEGNANTATGAAALLLNTTGSNNTAIGHRALLFNSTGFNNTAIGQQALHFNSTGSRNTAIGQEALYFNTGSENAAIGYKALHANTTGFNNIAIGTESLSSNTTGFENIAIGSDALLSNDSGANNIAIGDNTLFLSNDGNNNLAIGAFALLTVTSGSDNIGIGLNANAAVSSGSNNIAIGNGANVPSGADSDQIRMGNSAIANAYIQVPWQTTSDKRWKEKIRDLPYGLDFVKQLNPVDYVRKNNAHKTRETGFIAQDVELVLKESGYDDQGFLTKDDDGYISLRYNDFIALLTKAIQEQQDIIEKQDTDLKDLKAWKEKVDKLLSLNN